MSGPERIVYLKSGEVAVEKGDSLSSIAARYHVSPKALASCNNLVHQQSLAGIKTLMLPGKKSMAAEPPVDRSQPSDGPVLLLDNDSSIWSDEESATSHSNFDMASESTTSKSMPSDELSTADVNLDDLEDVVMGGTDDSEFNQKPRSNSRAKDGLLEAAQVETKSKPKSARFSRPASGEITEPFQKNKRGAQVPGIKLRAPLGTAVRAVADGKVVISGKIPGDSSKVMVLIRHGDGWTSCYKALADSAVAKNTTVKQGDLLGTSQGPELIFELRNSQRVAVDPALYWGR